ncbi:hypothetical protein [Actinomadura sp. NTSP31]|uniref:hypothetical protein n=1 Tax=Actinomadura sp. NTSP31 TaxID=1735447 RepID=UPI0035C195E7
MPHPPVRLSTCAALLMITCACGTADRKATADRSASAAIRPTAPADTDRMKQALLPIPPAQSKQAFRYGPMTGPYEQLMKRIVEGKTWPSEPCAQRTMLPGRIQQLGEKARFSPAALAMWVDETRNLTITETIIKLPKASAQLLVAMPTPKECHAYDFTSSGNTYRAILKSDELHQRDGISERTRIWEYRAGKATNSAVHLTSRRGDYAILLSLSPTGRLRTSAYQDLIKQAEDHATTTLKQAVDSRT